MQHTEGGRILVTADVEGASPVQQSQLKEGAKPKQGHPSPRPASHSTSAYKQTSLFALASSKKTTPKKAIPSFSHKRTPPLLDPSKEAMSTVPVEDVTPKSSSPETTPSSALSKESTTPSSHGCLKETTPTSPAPKETTPSPSKETSPSPQSISVVAGQLSSPVPSKETTPPHQVKTKPKISKAEREKQKAEAKAKREEERLKKEQEKLQREQEKREKQLKREQELKERREKKEREELEKKERREKREAEKKKKEEERKKREEEKKKKQDEKLRMEQEKEIQREEKLRRENQAKMKFRGYFGKIDKPVAKVDIAASESILTPFSVKDWMTLAKAPHPPLEDTAIFDQLTQLQNKDFSSDYITQCRSCSQRRRKKRGTVEKKEAEGGGVVPESDGDVLVEAVSSKPAPPKFKYKLLQFAENYRPAYYGTWRKSTTIKPRNPFHKDETLLDYEVESDMEWEEEEPGESISNSEGEEKDGDGEGEDSDDDDGFFVPHGYLSNDEGDCSDSGEFIPDEGESPQDAKKRKQLAKAWEVEFARKCQPLEPKMVGCLWLLSPPSSVAEEAPPPKVLTRDEAFLMQFAVVPLVSLPLVPTASKGETSAEKQDHQGSCSGAESTKQPVPEEAMPELIRFLHKNAMGMNRISKLFRTHWGAKVSQSSSENAPSSPNLISASKSTETLACTPKGTRNPAQFQEFECLSGISQRQMERKIKAIAVKELRLPITKSVWYVHAPILKQYGLEQEDFVPLVQDTSGSPLLCEKVVEQLTPSSASKPLPPSPESVKTAGKGVKRKPPNGVGKSLLKFLMPATKHPKIELPQNGKSNDDVIIIGSSSVEVKSPSQNTTAKPSCQVTAKPPTKTPSHDAAELTSSCGPVTTQGATMSPRQDTATPSTQNSVEQSKQDASALPVAKKPRLAIASPTMKDISSSSSDILQDSTNSITNKSLKALLMAQEPITII